MASESVSARCYDLARFELLIAAVGLGRWGAKKMAAVAELAHTYRYPFPSHLEEGWGLRLATSGTARDLTANPYFFEGPLVRPDELSEMLLVVSNTVRSRFFQPGALREIDPVVTCSEHALRFEGFSSCCGVYARADLDGAAFEGGLSGRGTTNVDFNAPMRGALGRLRHTRAPRAQAHLAVGAKEVKLTTGVQSVVEKKVKLPLRWVKGFVEVQAYLGRLRPVLEVDGAEVPQFLRSLPRGGSPKRPSFVVPLGRGLRLTPRGTPGGVAVMGTERLRLLEPLAPRAKALRVWSEGSTGVSAWEIQVETGRLWLVISPDVARGFSGEGQVLSDLSGPDWERGLHAVRAQLKWQTQIDAARLGSAAQLDRAQVSAALAVLGSQGLVGFDPSSGAYFHRELPFDLSRVESLHPRLAAARKLVAEGAVRWKQGSASGEAMVRGSGVEHRVRLAPEGDHCTCRWFSKYQGERGVCKHILAARIDLEGEDASA